MARQRPTRIPGRPRVGNVTMHNVQYQFEVNGCRNEEVNFQGSSANSDGQSDGWANFHAHGKILSKNTCIPNIKAISEGTQQDIVARTDGQTDGQTPKITTISPRFLKSVGIIL
ncbi:hypothetical protein DPMN_037121 [Dreissena polymorpha]|uniref:Uncharacterized protein n=1 Tax=Dreissena polymorpha TaxID=45954 RepID=A0A9D4MES3_DREPO|nr:hypothetical protein DPMN_037121 [Dreissena polymorpha]